LQLCTLGFDLGCKMMEGLSFICVFMEGTTFTC
jgi:hypothetical protein